jgi:uncharacterized Zn finger protein (UPF0148 family)
MATTQCPVCRLTVPYFCCEGLVCPACGYDEEQKVLPQEDAVARPTPQAHSQPPLPTDSGSPQAAVE